MDRVAATKLFGARDFGATDIAAAIEVTDVTEAGEVTGATAAAEVADRFGFDTGATLWDDAGAAPEAAPPAVLGTAEDPPPEAAPLPEFVAPLDVWALEPRALVCFGDPPPEAAPLLAGVPLLEAVSPVAVLGAADDPTDAAPVLAPFVGASDLLSVADELDPSPVSA